MRRNRVIALGLVLCLLCACTPRHTEASPSPMPVTTATPEPSAPPTATLSPEPSETPAVPTAEIRMAVWRDTTTLGMAKLMADAGETPGRYGFALFGEADEVADTLMGGDADIALLPTNLASVLYHTTDGGVQLLCISALGQLTILDTGEMDRLDDAGLEDYAREILATGCAVVRADFAREHPDRVSAFLTEYAASVAYMADPANLEEAAALAETWGLADTAAEAQEALPHAGLCFFTGDDMMAVVQDLYQILFLVDPASIGGSIPDGAFYYRG